MARTVRAPFTLDVSTPAAFPTASRPTALSEAVDTELAVSVVTPVSLAAQSSHGAFVLAHRATIVVSELDWALVEALLRDLVERRCAAPSLEHGLASLQRCVRIPWETSLSRLMPMDTLDP